jgi:hypothetical protein
MTSLQIGRRVGRPAPFRIVAGFFASAVLCLAAATIALARAAPDLAAGRPTSPRVLLAVHLVALGFLPFAVGGGALHILPVLLRNGAPAWRARLALPLLWAGPVLAYGISAHRSSVAYPALIVTGAGVAILLSEVGVLVFQAPRGRIVLASRVGVVLSGLHALAAFVLGALIFGVGWRPLRSVSDDRLVAIHLNLAVLGWLTMLIIAVGRTLGPMLALAPSAGERRLPVDELLLAAGLWLVLVGIATAPSVAAAGAALILIALVRFGLLMNRVRRGQRLRGFEGPIAHFLTGLAFLAQAALTGLWLLHEHKPSGRLEELYVLFFLGGWAAGVTLGHLGKLFSLSAWASWPPGPRPRQTSLYPRRTWLVEALLFAVGIETLADGILAHSQATAYIGASALIASAAVAAAAALATWQAARPALDKPPAKNA